MIGEKDFEKALKDTLTFYAKAICWGAQPIEIAIV
jgi:hypothetical protein